MTQYELEKLLDKRVADLTVLEFQELLNAMEESEASALRVKPDKLDLANRVGDIPVRCFMALLIDSVPQGNPLP